MPKIEEYETAISTLRLCLDPMMALHAKAMFPVLSDPRLYRFTGEEPPVSEMSLETRYRYLEGRKSPDKSELWLNWLVRIEDSGAAIGYVQATVSDHHTDIAWVIGSKWQGNGYASEAALAIVQWLGASGVKQVRACINPNHLASQRVARNVGLNKTDFTHCDEDIWLL